MGNAQRSLCTRPARLPPPTHTHLPPTHTHTLTPATAPPPHTHTCPHTHSPTPAPPPIHTHTPAPPQAEHLGIKQAGLRMDSQVKYGLLSRGDASIFMRFPPTSYREKIWDHLPGFIIVEEAGGKVTDGTGKRLDFSKGRFLDLTNGLISAPPTVHAALVEAIAKVTLPL